MDSMTDTHMHLDIYTPGGLEYFSNSDVNYRISIMWSQ